MTEAEFASQRRLIGRAIHEHDGVWWEVAFPFYAKPAFEFRSFPPGTARPARLKAPLCFTHQIPEMKMANAVRDYMILEGEDLHYFSLERLPRKRRNKVRKGLISCEVRAIEDLEPYLEAALEANIRQAQRHLPHHRPGDTPLSFYVDHAETWRAQKRRDFSLAGEEWWGAFVEDKLVAYIISFQVENVRLIKKVISHTDHMKMCPIDALYYTVLKHASDSGSCEKIVDSAPRRPSLDRYKEAFLFRQTPVPYYTSNPWLLRFVLTKIRKVFYSRS